LDADGERYFWIQGKSLVVLGENRGGGLPVPSLRVTKEKGHGRRPCLPWPFLSLLGEMAFKKGYGDPIAFFVP
jgi:hypothetical protein